MFIFTLQHKHCGAIKQVEGYDQWDAYKKNNIDSKVWLIRAIDSKA